MLSIIITALLLVAGIVLAIVGERCWSDIFSILGACFLILSVPITVIIVCASLTRNPGWEQTKYDYAFTKELIENYEPGDDYGNIPSITEKVLHINRTIAKHKAYCNSAWFGVWYSEEIGNLEPLTLPKRNQKL